MKYICVVLLVLDLLAVCFRYASALSDGAPTAACVDLTQQHFGVTPENCGSPCPFTVSLVAIDGSPPTSPNMYRCGSQHTSEYIAILHNSSFELIG